jgi:hypothetical protein
MRLSPEDTSPAAIENATRLRREESTVDPNVPYMPTVGKEAHERSSAQLKGWFKTKTGAGDAVAEKMASTFGSLADYADFDAAPAAPSTAPTEPPAPATTPMTNGTCRA